MERNEQDIFDELVRQKLTGYTEPPEPAWIKNIHAKKNRVINLYHLYRMMLITALVGAGMFSSIYYFTPRQAVTGNHMPENRIVIVEPRVTATQHPIDNTEFAAAFAGNQLHSGTASDKNYSSSHSNSTTSFDRTNTLNKNNTTNNTAGKNRSGQQAGKAQHNSQIHSGTTQSKANQSKIATGKRLTSDIIPSAKQAAEKQQAVKEEKNSQSVQPSAQRDSVSVNTRTKEEPTDQKEDKTKETAGNCNASFEYYTSYNGEISFTNTSIASAGASMSWSFGDGDRSIYTDPSHSFTKTGTYEVTLHIKDAKLKCEDSYTKSISFHNPDDRNVPVAITGILYAGGSVVKNGFVELYVFDESKGGYVNNKTVKTTLAGEFRVPIQKGKRYLLKGNPTLDQPDYTATFWGNTTQIEDASDVIAMLSEDHDLLGYNIDLQMGEKQAVDEEVNPVNPIAGAEQNVLLLDANNNIVSVGTVDANGNFNFGEVKPGEYTIVNPATGATSVKIVGAAGNASGNIYAGASGSQAVSSEEKVTVFPNPANTVVNFGINSLTEEKATIVIMNAGGVELSREVRNFTSGFNQAQYDLSAYPPGIYYVLVFKGNQQVLSNRLVKLSTDNTK